MDEGRDSAAARASDSPVKLPFHIINPGARGLPLVLAAPHGGRDYPAALLQKMRDPRGASLRLEDRHVDSLAAEIAALVPAPVLVADSPRALIDLNRAEDDIDWGMVRGGGSAGQRHSAANRRARSGLGLVPRRLPGSGEIWREALDPQELEERIETVHRPYHRQLAAMLEAQRDQWGAVLLVDLHSMPPLPPRFPGESRVRAVLGDRYGASCDAAISARALARLAALGWPSAHNRPYAGGYGLDRHGQPRRGVHAVQIEVCRTSYLDDALLEPGEGLAETASALAAIIRELGEVTAALGNSRLKAQAAE